MTASSRPDPGSRAAVLDSVVRYVAEGRYRMAQLHLIWHRDRAPLEEMAELVNTATEVPTVPFGLTAEAVLAVKENRLLPVWLGHQVGNEVRRIFAGQPVAGASPVQLVARVAAAMRIDVAAESSEAATRAHLPESPLADDLVVADLTDGAAGDRVENPHSRLIHLGRTETINLGDPRVPEPGPAIPPPPR